MKSKEGRWWEAQLLGAVPAGADTVSVVALLSFGSAVVQQLRRGSSGWKLNVGNPEVPLNMEVRSVGTAALGSSVPLDLPRCPGLTERGLTSLPVWCACKAGLIASPFAFPSEKPHSQRAKDVGSRKGHV